jgi:hypothetical protein
MKHIRELQICKHLVGLLFNPEDGGRMFFQNTGKLLPDSWHHTLEAAFCHCCENHKSNKRKDTSETGTYWNHFKFQVVSKLLP